MVVIALSGLPGTGSSTAGRLVAKKLDIEYFSAGTYNKEHAKSVAGKDVEKETEKAVVMWKIDRDKLDKFHLNTEDMYKEMARKGNIIIDAKLAIWALKGIADFSVWITASLDSRAKRIAGRDNISIEEAERILEEKLKLEVENWKRIYGINYLDQEKEADIVIDTSGKNPEEIADIIINELRSRSLV
jgi:cytidylate kinase